MKKTLVSLVAILALTQPVLAASVSDILTNLLTARETLMKMLDETDVAKRDALEQEMRAASKAAEAALAAVLADAATPAETKKALEEFQTYWTQSKEIRQKEILDVLKAGKVEEAKKFAMGPQKERFEHKVKTLEGLIQK